MRVSYLLIPIIFYTVYVVTPLFMYNDENVPVINFIDVGQGDSILIEYLNSTIFVDGGPDLSANYFMDSVKFFPFCSLDYIFISHPHSDHLFGFTKLLKRCTFKKLFFNDLKYDSKLVTNFVRDLNNSGYQILTIQAGDSLSLGDMTLYILWPDWEYRNLIVQNPNYESIVILIDYHDFEILLTGDAEVKVLEIILKNSKEFFAGVIDGELEILKVPHHGAVNGLHTGLYNYLNPKYCVISVGQGNTYGHPDQKAIDFFEKSDCIMLRTDSEGNIIFKLE